MLAFLKAAEHLPLRADEQIEPTYRRLRWQIFVGIFVGYAGFYLVRLNFNLAMPYLVDQGYGRGALGFALSGVSIRSEEHTSELQSHSDLVCRLLLEKKKTCIKR